MYSCGRYIVRSRARVAVRLLYLRLDGVLPDLRFTCNQLRAATHQRLARADDGHMGLALFAPMLEWVQQLRVHSCQAREVLGVYLIGLLLVGVDEPELPCIGHKDLMTALL
jgi:hypothetical protein